MNQINKQGSWRIDSKRADKSIKFCPSCKQCYEDLYDRRWQSKNIIYYNNFPSYKKEKRICFKCLNKE